MEFEVKKLKKRTLLFILGVGITLGLFAIHTVLGIFAIFGYDTVVLFDRTYHGILGMLVAWINVIIGSFVLTIVTWLASILGLWLYSLKWNLIVEYHPVKTPAPESSDSV